MMNSLIAWAFESYHGTPVVGMSFGTDQGLIFRLRFAKGTHTSFKPTVYAYLL